MSSITNNYSNPSFNPTVEHKQHADAIVTTLEILAGLKYFEVPIFVPVSRGSSDPGSGQVKVVKKKANEDAFNIKTAENSLPKIIGYITTHFNHMSRIPRVPGMGTRIDLSAILGQEVRVKAAIDKFLKSEPLKYLGVDVSEVGVKVLAHISQQLVPAALLAMSGQKKK